MSGNHSGHNHNHNHGHDHEIVTSAMSKGKLMLVILFNLIISIAEIIGGIISGSLSLISDAIHNFSDTISIILSYVSIRISEKPKDKRKTFGYKRANIITAFINSAALIGIAVYLMIEAVNKFMHPTEISGNIVIIVAVIGLLGNLFSVIILRKSAKQSINIKSSYLHLISDTLSSVAVIISGIIIRFSSIYWVDSLLTILINIVILRAAFLILKDSIHILMQGAPLGIDTEQIIDELTNIDEVRDIHHLHVWKLDENDIILESHVKVDDMMISDTSKILKEIQLKLHEKYGINHIVLQFETTACSDEVCKI